jgi:hypothetical protein
MRIACGTIVGPTFLGVASPIASNVVAAPSCRSVTVALTIVV